MLRTSVLGALASSAAAVGLRVVPAALVDQARRSNHTGGCSVAGEPTSYRGAGCWKISSVYGQVNYEGSRLVSVGDCYLFCKTKWKQGIQYFGVTEGNKCWCGKVHDGTAREGRSCDQPCAGDPRETCGGVDAANVFVMIDCTPPTPAEIAADANSTKAAIMNSYAEFKGQTCGQGSKNNLEVNGKETLVGSVEECKIACSKGSMQCHGFTYDQRATKCSFHTDVLDGAVSKDKAFGCFFKKLA